MLLADASGGPQDVRLSSLPTGDHGRLPLPGTLLDGGGMGDVCFLRGSLVGASASLSRSLDANEDERNDLSMGGRGRS